MNLNLNKVFSIHRRGSPKKQPRFLELWRNANRFTNKNFELSVCLYSNLELREAESTYMKRLAAEIDQ